jgi:hypothetical protein
MDAMRDSYIDCVKSLSKESLNSTGSIEDSDIDETLLKIEI